LNVGTACAESRFEAAAAETVSAHTAAVTGTLWRVELGCCLFDTALGVGTACAESRFEAAAAAFLFTHASAVIASIRGSAFGCRNFGAN
jgi:hypothetical protein